MARFYANENFALPVVIELRRLGHDIITVQEAGKANLAIPDEDVLAYAVSENRAVLTFNRKDFKRLHAAKPAHAGIVICTYDADMVSLANRIHAAVIALPSLAGHLVKIVRPSKP